MTILVNAYCTTRELPPLEFPHSLNSLRDLNDAELPEHLEGFAGYVAGRGEAMTQTRYHVIRHVLRVQHHLSLELESEHMDAFAGWAAEANALVFLSDGTVRDPKGAVLVHPTDLEPDTDAEIPFPQDAHARKAVSMERLEALEIEVPASLPPVLGAGEVELRQPIDVARRALGLLVLANRAESLNHGSPLPLETLREQTPQGFLALSPREKEFLAADPPDRQEVVQSVWRYEALFLLQWALGLTDKLPLPTGICDVPALRERMRTSDLSSSPSLRPVGEILAALDLHLRLHWAVRQARLDEKEPPGDLSPGVVLERHYALNWLIRFEEAEWDEVDVPT
ncbi:MAG: DUF4272 domain-containing protein [Planctomycetes bacterium]|nr:DUF4272 domain-containing protein [Planctomycetota bacterium]